MSSSKPQTRVADLAYIAVFAAFVIVLGNLYLPGPAGVPFVLQNAACILTGLILGPRRGFLAIALFLLLGLTGLPVLSGKSVLAALGGPTTGYLLGYLISPALAGAIAWKGLKPDTTSGKTVGLVIAGAVAALLVQYLTGAIGFTIFLKMGITTALVSQVSFMGPDAIKLVACILITLAVHRALPDLRRRLG